MLRPSRNEISRRQLLFAAPAALLAPAPETIPDSVLVHEHVLVDFAGVAGDSRSRYSLDEAFQAALPRIEELKQYGCVRFLECTPNGLGRDPRLLLRLQKATGIEFWTNTGIYGAAKRAGVPKYAHEETAEQLARRWIGEFQNGVEGMKPRFIKTAVNVFPLEPIDVKLVTASAITSKETGLMICSHTNGGGPAAMAQLEILDKMKCPASKFVWVHAQSEKDHSFHERAARAGAWTEFDGINEKSAAWHLDCVRHMQSKGLLGQTLVSQDSGWYRVGEPGGGRFNGFTFIYTGFLPQLDPPVRKALMVDNPRRAFNG
jgi:phosphotriesterase-related protein